MCLLLTNDDGYDAPGLRALEAAARELGQVVVVAPRHAHSGCSHRVTTDAAVRVEQPQPGCFVVEGTPADCVRMARHGIATQTAWVLAGINAGGNLGADVYLSGTVAAVREAVLHGWRGIALSQYRRKDRPFDWERAQALVLPVLRDLLARPCDPGTFWNVNLPHPEPDGREPQVVFCPLDPLPLPLSYRQVGDAFHYNGDYHGRRRQRGADVDVCFGGDIAVTRLSLG
jgi:5'-nucleotidase